MKTIKLSGNFEWGERLSELFQTMEDARLGLEATVESDGHGSAEYFEALKQFKEAKAEHEAHRDSRRTGQ